MILKSQSSTLRVKGNFLSNNMSLMGTILSVILFRNFDKHWRATEEGEKKKLV
jgi:hypothetical protein